MSELSFSEQKMKNLVKTAIIEVVGENQDLLQKTLEDAAIYKNSRPSCKKIFEQALRAGDSAENQKLIEELEVWKEEYKLLLNT